MERLYKYFDRHLEEGICIAFSGGVDSSLLLKAACLTYERRLRGTGQVVPQEDGMSFSRADALNGGHNRSADGQEAAQTGRRPILRPIAVTFQTRLHPHGDPEAAEAMAKQFGALFHCIRVDELAEAGIGGNPVDRCYLCKKLLFTRLASYAESKGYAFLADGTNYDDRMAYRPGMRALKELSIYSPLLELGISKAQIRVMAAEYGIPSADRPSAPCLATRLPYGTRLDYELFGRIDTAEDYLRSLGFYNVRIRIHGEIARIEVDTADFERFLMNRELIAARLKQLGFCYLTLDIEGFRSGSMDIHLSRPVEPADFSDHMKQND